MVPSLPTHWLRWHDGAWRGLCHWTDDQYLTYQLWVPV